jgi:UDP-N-acetylglucosamine 2-epimerase (non-hydrolysing)
MHILHVVGARPNFMKAAPVVRALGRRKLRQTLVHAGQHYSAGVSDVFFRELGMPEPDVNLAVGSGTHAWQTAEVMNRLEPVLLKREPDVVLVYGDVNSTVAAALVCSKLGIRVAHVEAGLRSFDRTMPEELNRIVTDQLSDLLFTPSPDADENLAQERIPPERVRRVGNVMIDTLLQLLPEATGRRDATAVAGLNGHPFALVTLHRPSNVDDADRLGALMAALAKISRDLPIIFPIHPRTAQRIRLEGFKMPETIRPIDPQGYVNFLALQSRATLVITDSGGVQEETTFLGVPCLTLRPNTERPVTVTMGTNTLVGEDLVRLQKEVRRILDGGAKAGTVPPLWDGCAAERLADVLCARKVSRSAA